jgi:sortase (surface protein transpeptidase)
MVHAQTVANQPLRPVAASTAPPPAKTATAATPHVLPRSEPKSISIPSVGIEADAISVGQLADGSMETPPLFDWTVGWYRLGPTPGELGPAVIVGHVDTYKGPSVFWRLRELQPGDLVNITRADGSVATFKVTSLGQYSQNDFPTQAVYGNIDHAGLRLITCGGAFDQQTLHYTENTVVYADLVTP